MRAALDERTIDSGKRFEKMIDEYSGKVCAGRCNAYEEGGMSTNGGRMCKPNNSKQYWKEVVDMQAAEEFTELLRNVAPMKPLPLKEFKMRVDGLRFRLIENWCMCKYCQLFDSTNDKYESWLSEFIACAEYLRGVEVGGKVNKRKTISKMFIDDYDYNQERKALFIIREKFDALNINDMTKRNAIATIFVNSINGLIDVLAAPQTSISEYVRATFQYSGELLGA